MPITGDEARGLIRRLETAMNDRTLDDLDDVVAPNFVRHCEATPDVDVRSREQFKEFLVNYTAAFPDNVQTFTQVVAEGDRIGIWANYKGTHTGAAGAGAGHREAGRLRLRRRLPGGGRQARRVLADLGQHDDHGPARSAPRPGRLTPAPGRPQRIGRAFQK